MSIQEHLNKIRNAIEGSEVRESIAKGIETAYDDASENGNANMEVRLARGTNPNLNTRLNKMDEVDKQTTEKLAQTTAEAFRKKDLEDLTPRVLSAIEGGEDTEINLLSIPQNYSVSPKKTTFVKETNLWDGKHHRYIYMGSESGNIINRDVERSYFGSAVIEVEPGREYTVLKQAGGNRFNIGVVNELPEFGGSVESLYIYRGSFVSRPQHHTFTVPEGGNFLVVHLNSSYSLEDASLPDITVSEGNQATDYDALEFNQPIKGYVRLDKINGGNVFDGNYIEGMGVYSYIEYPVVTRVASLDDGVIAIVPIEPYKTYKVEKSEPTTRFRLALSYTNDVSNEIIIAEENSLYVEDSMTSFEFKNKDAPFLIIGVSNSGEKPDMTVTEFSYELKEGNTEITLIESNSIEKHHLHSEVKKELESSRRTPYLMNPIKEIYDSPDSLSNVDRSSHLKIYERYDQLVSEFPDYVSKEKIGEDGLGNEIFAYNFIAPELTSTPPDKKPYRIELAITTGVHGREWIATLALLRFMEELCYNPRNREEIDEIKWSVDFSIVPIVCPNGFDAVQRHNHNGVNINRNFDSNWVQTGESGSSPASELETQAVQQWLNELDKTYYFVDFHMISAPTPMGYSPDSETTTLLQGLFRTLTRKWRKDYDLPYEHKIYGYTVNPIASGDTTGYARKIGLQSFLLEGASEFFLQESYGDKIAQKQTLDVFGNFVIAFVNNK